MITVLSKLAPAAKSIASAFGAFCAYFGALLGDDGTLADLSQGQWLLGAAFILGSAGITFAVPNRPKG